MCQVIATGSDPKKAEQAITVAGHYGAKCTYETRGVERCALHFKVPDADRTKRWGAGLAEALRRIGFSACVQVRS